MPDREKVIKGLQAHADGCGYRSHHCDAMKCPYRYVDESCDIEEMCRDAIELLKEPEAVEPIPPKDESDLWRCGYCHHQIFRCTHQRFCEECGRKIEWEDM